MCLKWLVDDVAGGIGSYLKGDGVQLRLRLGTRCKPHSQKIQFFFLLKFNMICMFWIVLMCWCQKWFLKIEKNIIDMHFGTKSYLKSNRYHTVKHSLYQHWSTLAWNYWRRGGTRLCRHLFLWEKKSWQSVPNYHNLMNYTRWVL
jgi:hypothetical protein